MPDQNNISPSQTEAFAQMCPESKTSPITVKLTDTQKTIIQEFCFQNDLSASEFIRDAAGFYRLWFPLAEKLGRYRDAMVAMLDRLP